MKWKTFVGLEFYKYRLVSTKYGDEFKYSLPSDQLTNTPSHPPRFLQETSRRLIVNITVNSRGIIPSSLYFQPQYCPTRSIERGENTNFSFFLQFTTSNPLPQSQGRNEPNLPISPSPRSIQLHEHHPIPKLIPILGGQPILDKPH